MKTRILTLTTALMGTAFIAPLAANAGSADVAIVEPVPATPVVVDAPAPVGNWGGAYGGLSFGAMKGEVLGDEETAPVYGVFGGYDYQFGKGIVGAEVEYSGNDDLSVNGVDVDNIARFKLRGGYDLGRTMVYATAGVSKIETNFGDATSPVGGFGMEYAVSDRFGIGAEYLNENFEDIGSTTADVKANSLSLRGTLRF